MTEVILNDLRKHKDALRKLVFSDRSDKSFPYEKICVRPFTKKVKPSFSSNSSRGRRCFI